VDDGHFAAGPILERLGAEVSVIHDAPDGTNINEGCGATDTASLRQAVVDLGADVGIAVDALGRDVDGDQILAILALDRRDRGALPDDTVVVTVMSNLGFRQAMDAHGVHVVETAVGDRAVLDALDERNLALGGEQSGHVIQRDLATTGDGILTAVHLADVVVRTARPLADLAGVMVRLPQVLRNVPLPRAGADVLDAVADDVAAVEAEDAADRLVRAVTDAVA